MDRRDELALRRLHPLPFHARGGVDHEHDPVGVNRDLVVGIAGVPWGHRRRRIKRSPWWKLKIAPFALPPGPPGIGVDAVIFSADRGEVAGDVGPDLARERVEEIDQRHDRGRGMEIDQATDNTAPEGEVGSEELELGERPENADADVAVTGGRGGDPPAERRALGDVAAVERRKQAFRGAGILAGKERRGQADGDQAGGGFALELAVEEVVEMAPDVGGRLGIDGGGRGLLVGGHRRSGEHRQGPAGGGPRRLVLRLQTEADDRVDRFRGRECHQRLKCPLPLGRLARLHGRLGVALRRSEVGNGGIGRAGGARQRHGGEDRDDDGAECWHGQSSSGGRLP